MTGDQVKIAGGLDSHSSQPVVRSLAPVENEYVSSMDGSRNKSLDYELICPLESVDVGMLLSQASDTSIGNYTFNLIEALNRNGVRARVAYMKTMTLRSSKWEQENVAKAMKKSSLRIFTIPQLPRSRVQLVNLGSGYLNFRLRKLFQAAVMQRKDMQKFELYHYAAPDFDATIQPKDKPSVLTCHDLVNYMPRYGAPSHERLNRRITTVTFGRMIKEYSLIIAVSNATKRSLINMFNYPERKVRVVYHGINHDLFRPPAPHALRDEFILLVSSSVRRKNKLFVMRLFKSISDRVPGIKFVCVGFEPEEVLLARKLGIETKIVFLKDLEQSEVVRLYQKAKLYISPSLYEGFGLTLLEAMACGCPIVTSDNSAIPEVVGKSCVLLGETDVQSWSDACVNLIFDDKSRKEISEKEYARSLGFSWDKCARETARVYEEALGLQ